MGNSRAVTANVEAPPAVDRSFFGQPRGLATLFGTEMWERFSFYGMRAILVLFLVAPREDGGFGMAVTTAAAVYAIYNAMVYMLSIPGGWIADRLWGARRSVLWGGVVIAAGHYSMAVPAGDAFIWAGLILIALGTGLLKPNISAIVGGLYAEEDERRDAGFSLFYMGINLGAFVAPLVCGFLAEKIDWHWGFAAAGVGMTLALVQYVAGRHHLRGVGERPAHPATASERRVASRGALALLGIAVLLLLLDAVTEGIEVTHVVTALTLLAVAVPVAFFTAIYRSDLSDAERCRITAFVSFFLAATLFWMIFDQAGSLLNLFAQDRTDRHLLGFQFPASWFQSLNPLMIIALAPLFAALWLRLGSRQPSTAVKFSFGLLGIGLSFAVMGAAAAAAGGGLVSPAWLLSVYFLQTCAELCLSPVGLAVTTRLAPVRFGSQTMGLWFLATATGNALNTQTVKLIDVLPRPVYYGGLGAVAVLAGLCLLTYATRLRRLMAGVH